MKPVFLDIDSTTSVFQSSTTTYSSSAVTYSSSLVLYGGSDTLVDRSPMFMTIKDLAPVMMEVTTS